MALSVNKNDVDRMQLVLRDLMEQTEAEGSVLCESGGYVLAQEGPGTQDPLLLSALGAGVFAGSRELAKILGEDEFSAVFHQGESRSIFIRAVNAEVLLVVVFSKGDTVGLVKLYSARAATRLHGVFEEVYARAESMDHDEQSFILNEDEVFKIKD